MYANENGFEIFGVQLAYVEAGPIISHMPKEKMSFFLYRRHGDARGG